MDYKKKYYKYINKYNNLIQKGGGNLSYKLTNIFIEIYFETGSFKETQKEFEFQLQNYVNKLKIPIKYEDRKIYVLKDNNEIYVEIKVPKYYFTEETYFQENTEHGEPYLVNFLSMGINMFYNFRGSVEKDLLPTLVAALIYNMGKYGIPEDQGNNILNRNDKKHQNYRDENILKKLNLTPEDITKIKKILGKMNKQVIEESRFGRYQLVKMIEEKRTVNNHKLCDQVWKMVTSNLYDYSQKFTIKDNIFRSRIKRTNDEVKQLISSNISKYNLSYSDIIKFCSTIKDETNLKINEILKRIFVSSIKAGTECSELGKGACGEEGVWNTKDGKISGEKNSPPKVTYFANLMTKFLDRFFTKKIRAFVVGGIFPSYFINQEIKDYDFVMLSNIKDFRSLLLPIIFLFCEFCEVAQGIGKLPDGNIVIKDESKNGNDKPRNFNIRIDVPNFEGLDIVLPRNLGYEEKTKQAYEEDINMESIKNINDDQEINSIILTDLRRRECYLNALYGELSYNLETDNSEINIYNYLPKGKARGDEEKQFVRYFNESFRNWQEYPTDGLDTFISDYFRVIRIFKMNLKKFFDGEPAIDLLNQNIIKVLEYYNQQNRDIIYNDKNGIVKMIELLKSKIDAVKNNRYDQKIEIVLSRINKFGEYLYKLSFIFFIVNNKLPYKSSDKKVLNIEDIYNQKISNLEKVINYKNDKIEEIKKVSYGPSSQKYLKKQSGEVNLRKIEKYLTFMERTRLFNIEKKRNKFFYINSSVSEDIFLERFRRVMKLNLDGKINFDELFTMILCSYLLPNVTKEEMSNKLYKSKIKDTYKVIEILKSQFSKPIKKYKIRSEFKEAIGVVRIHKILDKI